MKKKTSTAYSPSNFISELFATNDGNLVANALVGVEVMGDLSVVLLNDDPGSLLDRLGTNATHSEFAKSESFEK